MHEKFKALGLTKTEALVALDMARGLRIKEIAAKMFITQIAVRKHMTRIYFALQTPGRERFMVFAATNFPEIYAKNSVR